ncbi:MAG: hypothetical protein ABSG03_10565 [Bryobacteraceae bacterium]
MNLTIELDREEDGRWIANAKRVAIEVIADRIDHGELPPSAFHSEDPEERL